MLFIFYIFLAFIASFIGAMSGVGGGVIIKPVLDLFSGYDPSTISVLSSLTVFSMAIVSLIKSGGKSDIQNETWSSPVHLGFLGFGSVIGGLLGETLFDEIITLVESDSLVKIIQNIGLLAVTFGVFIFMLNIHKVPKYKFTRRSIYLVAGICLGTIAAFLGIGGGPLNVAAV
ncbi:MAG: sulfite exporter TauE/SafE family protein, partial [Spirochaetales bacterium]